MIKFKSLILALKMRLRPARDWARRAKTRVEPTTLAARRVLTPPLCRARLAAFQASGGMIRVSSAAAPAVSVILDVRDGPEFLLACLQSLLADWPTAGELVIVANAPTARTSRLLARIEGATLVRAEVRLSATEATRRALGQARGADVVLVDPASQLEPGSLTTALATLRSRPDAGAVVGRTIHADRSTAEAGSILWRDGSTSAYGAGWPGDDARVMFVRDVDFGAGSVLLATRAGVAGFLDREPGDGDQVLDRISLSAHLRKSGQATVYDPWVVATRLDRSDLDQQGPDPALVQARLGDRLNAQWPRSEANVLAARSCAPDQHRVFFLDDSIPYKTLGAGLPRARRTTQEMANLGYLVTYFPAMHIPQPGGWATIHASIDKRVEVISGPGLPGVESFLRERAGFYDILLISRPPNMAKLRSILPFGQERPRIVYDAEALFTARQITDLQLLGTPPTPEAEHAMYASEVALVAGCATILAVSPRDAQTFRDHGAAEVFTLSHCITPAPTPGRFEDRAGFLFVGPTELERTPNSDSIVWFVAEILPRIRQALGHAITFQVAGAVRSPEILQLEGNGVHLLGRVPDLTATYNAARVFVAPTRFAAGIPYKCGEAAAQGLPMVTTQLLADQLDWQDGVELLTAATADAFAAQCVRLYQDRDLWNQIRQGALDRVERSYSVQELSDVLRRSVGPRPVAVG